MTISELPTLRWVKREWDQVQYNSEGAGVGVIRRQERVLQQCVKTNEAPGYEWVDVPEVDETDARAHAHAREDG